MIRFNKQNKTSQEEITCCEKFSIYGVKRFYFHINTHPVSQTIKQARKKLPVVRNFQFMV
jgi:ribosomal protein L11